MTTTQTDPRQAALLRNPKPARFLMEAGPHTESAFRTWALQHDYPVSQFDLDSLQAQRLAAKGGGR